MKVIAGYMLFCENEYCDLLSSGNVFCRQNFLMYWQGCFIIKPSSVCDFSSYGLSLSCLQCPQHVPPWSYGAKQGAAIGRAARTLSPSGFTKQITNVNLGDLAGKDAGNWFFLWLGLVGMVRMGWRLGLVVLEAFSNLDDSLTSVFLAATLSGCPAQIAELLHGRKFSSAAVAMEGIHHRSLCWRWHSEATAILV